VVVAGVNGVLFGAVHLPEWDLTLVTVVAGSVWSWYYLRDRYLAPIALSHAVLGTTYFYWVRGRDLVQGWLGTP
jgi:membrane protease YdiL (CAAX protease family)